MGQWQIDVSFNIFTTDLFSAYHKPDMELSPGIRAVDEQQVNSNILTVLS